MSDSEIPVILDTHFWIWLQLGARNEFPSKVLKAILAATAHGNLLLSVISVWELGMLESKGRIRLQVPCDQWVAEALSTPGLTLAPLTPAIALDSTRLPGTFHGDPADRMIAATARRLGARLATRDERLLAYARAGHLKTVA